MKNKLLIIVLSVLLLAGCGKSNQNTKTQETNNQNTTDKIITLAKGSIYLSYPDDFSLANTPEEVTVASYIPACNENFDYCLYFSGQDYAGTNFESAGISIKIKRSLTTQSDCLNTQPDGYNGLIPQTKISYNYATGIFSGLGDAAAGHYSTGSLYRLFYDNACYEFQTRIGQSQYANYEPGTIKEFTSEQQDQLTQKLIDIIEGTTLDNNQKIFK